MENKPIIFSASMLQDFTDCQRRFELKYLRHQLWPAIPAEPIREFERTMQLGRYFHALAHQYFSGVPTDTIMHTIQDPTLHSWFLNFTKFIQHIPAEKTYSEFRLSEMIDGFRFIAIFDLILVSHQGEIIIFDWKTSPKPPRREKFSERMQSILYPVLLSNNIDLLGPNIKSKEDRSISMIYWFPAYPENAISLEFSKQDILDNKRSILRITGEINNKTAESDFPRTDETKLCKYCMYRSLCERGISAGSIEDENEISDDFLDIDFDTLLDLDLEI